MRRKTLKTGILCWALLAVGFAFGADFSTLEEAEIELVGIQLEMRAAKEDAVRLEANDRFTTALRAALQSKDAFDYPFEQLLLFKKTSDDDKVRIFNWNTSANDGTYAYFGFVLLKNEKTKAIELIELQESTKKVSKVEYKTLDAENWPGALYYDIVSLKKGKRTYYT